MLWVSIKYRGQRLMLSLMIPWHAQTTAITQSLFTFINCQRGFHRFDQ